MKQKIDDIVEKIEEIMEWGGTAKDITLLVISALALLISIFHLVPGLPFDAAWVAIILAMTGILNPVVGALVHNCGSVFVIINSAFLMSYTYRNI